MKFHHIGIATNDINKSIEKLNKYFDIQSISKTVYDENQDAYLSMLTMKDGIKIELITGKVVENILRKKIKELENDGAVLVREPRKAILFNNKEVAFLMWDLGLIELINSGGGNTRFLAVYI